MGYTTEYYGEFTLNQPLDSEMYHYLQKFSRTRRMKRDSQVLESMGFGPAETFGVEGEYFVEGKGFAGQDNDPSVLDHNNPPSTQPGLWCQWVPNEEGTGIEWDGNEKFYDGEEWLIYIIDHFLAPKGYVLNGHVEAQGEEYDDRWHLVVKDNVVSRIEHDDYVLEERNAERKEIEHLHVERLNQSESYEADELFEQAMKDMKLHDLFSAWKEAKKRS